MKSIFASLLLLLIGISACKTDKKENTAATSTEALSLPEQVAMAHGFDNWKKVDELRFTFNVDRDTAHFERSWIWKPQTNEVTLIADGDTLTYNRSDITDSILAKKDAGFINDKFWFLAPYQLIWDQKSYAYDEVTETNSPVAGTPMRKLTITYGNEGGYTPGDAYDLYLDDQNMIREWTFRRSNKPAPGSDATWEGYQSLQGLQLATMHELGGGAKLYFSGVEVRTE